MLGQKHAHARAVVGPIKQIAGAMRNKEVAFVGNFLFYPQEKIFYFLSHSNMARQMDTGTPRILVCISIHVFFNFWVDGVKGHSRLSI